MERATEGASREVHEGESNRVWKEKHTGEQAARKGESSMECESRYLTWGKSSQGRKLENTSTLIKGLLNKKKLVL